MLYPLRDRLLGLILAVAAASPAAAENLVDMGRALGAASGRDWAGAEMAAARSGPIALDLIFWQKLRAGQGSWPEYRDFALRNGDWPGLELFYRRGDAVLTPDLPPAEVIRWFETRKPDTLNGETAYIAALQKADPKAVAAELARFWTEVVLTAPEETAFLASYGDRVKGADDARITRLLDQGEALAAERMIGRASPNVAAVAKARIALQAGRPGVDTAILALPQAQQADAGLALDRFRWRVKNKLSDLARDLMIERSTSAEALRDPGAWSGLRADYARAALRARDWVLAEKFAANHFLPEGHKDYPDLEWLAGYAALKGGAPDRALGHFRHLEAKGATPITLSRALYWQGRAYEAMGAPAAAKAAYTRAADHQTAFYGQLASEKIGAPMRPELALPGRAVESLPEWRGTPLTQNRLWQAGVWLAAAGYPEQGQRFFMQLAETAPPEDIGRMARLMMELRQPWHALRLAKAAAAKGGIYPAAYFPLTGLELNDHGIAPELVLAIARRESEFNHTANSHAGAKGLMQVMPGTARDMARVIGEPYDFARLTTDAEYNARLGSAYLRGLEDRFGYSVALISSGYNAGPGRPARWLTDLGDLRKNADPIDWVEMIPLDETRNYVMRVAEALPIYRARIHGTPQSLIPTWDLNGGGLMPPPPPPPIRLAVSARPPKPMRPLIEMAAGGVLRAVLAPVGVAPAGMASGAAPGPAAVSPAPASAPQGGTGTETMTEASASGSNPAGSSAASATR